MNDKDFDKIFGDKLREERFFKSQDSDWEGLTKRLDVFNLNREKDNRRRGAAWLWLLVLPIAGLLLWQMNDLRTQNKELARQLNEVQSQLAAYKLQHDTLVQKVQKTDTIIIYKYLDATHKEVKKNTQQQFSTKNTSDINGISSSRLTQDVPSVLNKFLSKKKPEISSLSPSQSRILTGNVPSVANDFLAEKTPVSNNSTALTVPINALSQDTTPSKLLNEERKIAELTDKLTALDKQITDLKQAIIENTANASRLADCATNQNLLKKQLSETIALTDSLKKGPLSINEKKTDNLLKSNRLFVGIQGGKINYKTTWKNSAGIDIYKNFESYQGGLKLEYALTDKVRLTAGGDFCPVSFLIFWQDPRYNLPAPQFDPTKEKYLKAESKQTLMQGNIGAKYLLTEGTSKWRPYVAAAYTIMHINSFQTKFTYQPLWGTTNREQTVESKAINVSNLLLLSGGLEYRFSKYGVAQAEAFYYKDVNKTHQTFDLFGARAAVLLNIK